MLAQWNGGKNDLKVAAPNWHKPKSPSLLWKERLRFCISLWAPHTAF